MFEIALFCVLWFLLGADWTSVVLTALLMGCLWAWGMIPL